MKLSVENLGAIKNGTIDLSKKLNVFCGPNGTGKTYMAYVVYGLLSNRRISIGKVKNDNLVEELMKHKKCDYKIQFSNSYKYREHLIKSLDYSEIFGVANTDAFKDTKITFRETLYEFESKIKEVVFERTIEELSIKISKKANSDVLHIEALHDTIASEELRNLIFLESFVLYLLAIYPISQTHIFPVERNSIYTFSKELSLNKQEAVDHFHAMINKGKGTSKADRFDLFFKSTNRYPKAIKDGLRIAEDLAEVKKNKSEFYEYAEEIEKELLHGKLFITADGEITFNPEQDKNAQLPIQMTASIVKTLSSLVVYLKHIAKKSDLIIIDEPEINLHPDNQIVLTRILARLINKGFRLLISTHSDYIIREMNNLIMLATQTKRLQKLGKTMGYNEQEYIKPKDIGVYYFDYPKKKTKNDNKTSTQVSITNIELTHLGFKVPSITDTIIKQNETTYKLYEEIAEDEEN
jgi:predicted ATPase